MRWQDKDRKVLEAIYELEQETLRADPGAVLESQAITDRTGIEGPELTWILSQLMKGGFIVAMDVSSAAKEEYYARGITPQGLQAIGQWPSPESVAAGLPALLSDLAGDRTDPDERNALQRIAENVTTGTLTALVLRHFPWLQ